MENNQFNQNAAQPAQSQSNFAVPQGDNQVTNPIRRRLFISRQLLMVRQLPPQILVR